MHLPVYIPYKTYLGLGGPQTFLTNLKHYFGKNGIKISRSTRKASLLFFPISYSRREVERFKSRGGKILQRLDGVYYPSQHGAGYRQLNQEIEDIYLNWADHIVFQSEYSRLQCFKMMGEKDPSDYTIIRNGVNKAIFYPTSSSAVVKGKVRFVTTGFFRKEIMIKPIIEALDSLVGKFDFELTVIGPLTDPTLETFLHRDYVSYQGSKSAVEIGEILRGSNVYLHSQINDNCPNSVLEAISTGLPVVGFDSGSMRELCFFSPELLAQVSEDLIQVSQDFDKQKLAEKILLCVGEYESFVGRARANAHLYDFEETAKEYIKAFQSQLSQPRSSSQVYDQRYQEDYREVVDEYEISRWNALRHFLSKRFWNTAKAKVLDYGAGSGLYAGLWEEVFSESDLYFADISRVALDKFSVSYPKHKDHLNIISDDRVDFPDNCFDVVISIEVMEHVESLDLYLSEIKRLLKPGGFFIWTTPCGNNHSIEHWYSLLTGQIQRTGEGYIRWAWEDPTHVRRLKSSEIRNKLLETGFGEVWFKYRAHFFSFVCSKMLERKLLPKPLAIKLMQLDYKLLRNFPNGASMIGMAKK